MTDWRASKSRGGWRWRWIARKNLSYHTPGFKVGGVLFARLLDRVDPDVLGDLLRGAWKSAAADKQKKKRSAARRRPADR